MSKKEIVVLFLLFITLSFTGIVFAQNDTSQEINSEETDLEDVYVDIGEVELKEDAGLTPDNVLYFVDDLVESISVGNDPEKALEYKEEKVAEAKEMIEQGKVEEAGEALQKVEKYSEILEKEVSPDIEKRVRESSKAVKNVLNELGDKLEDKQWKEVKEKVENHEEREDKIALAAKISANIKQLCETLSELDPLQYSQVCKTGEDAPSWQKRLDRELTKEQREEAKEFFEIMSQCFQNPRECQCNDISISAFAAKCNEIAPLAAACMEGNEDACIEMEEVEDPIDLLPDYLQDVLEEVEERYGDSQHDLHIPKECRDAGATDRESCMRVMFTVHAPEECVEALERGEISFTNEREARKACEDIMFTTHAPEECVEANIRNPKECGKLMFRENAPQECLDAGLTGESRSDEKGCREIMEKQGREHGRGEGFGPPPGFGSNCKGIDDPAQRLICYDSAIQNVGEEFERRGPPGGWPQPCQEANALTPESCREIMEQRGREEREHQDGPGGPPSGPGGWPQPCLDANALSPEACGEIMRNFQGQVQGPESQEGPQPPPQEQIPPPEQILPPQEQIPPPSDQTQEQTPPPEPSPQPESPPPTDSGSQVTGGFFFVDNLFFNYYYKR